MPCRTQVPCIERMSMNRPLIPAAVQAVVSAASEQKWTRERILSIRRWTAKLFSIRTTRAPAYRFQSGQFARLGVACQPMDAVQLQTAQASDFIWRAYSMASANYDEHLEFFSIVVPGGEFSTRLEHLQPGDEVMVEKASYGFLTTDRFVDGRDLWLLASGTGLAPFLSILHDPQLWQDYQHLILVHSVREAEELVYRDQILALPQHALLQHGKARLQYLPLVTRARVAGCLDARMTQLLADGRLAAAAGLPLEVEHSRLMICGNPQMAADLRSQLTGLGFRVGRRGQPGQLAFENYW